MATSSLLVAPVEVQRVIVGFLENRQDVVNMSRVNWHLNSVSKPFIYENISISWREWDEDPDSRLGTFVVKRPSMCPLPTLLRTMFKYPTLGTSVRTLCLTGPPHTRWRDHRDRIDGSCNLLWPRSQGPPIIDIRQKLGSLGLVEPETTLWFGTDADTRSDHEYCRLDYLVAILLSFCPRLVTFDLGQAFRRHCRILIPFLSSFIMNPARTAGAVPEFHQLRRLDLPRVGRIVFTGIPPHMVGWDHWAEAQDVALPFFYLPDLLHLSIGISNPNEFKWPLHPSPSPSASKLTSLEICGLREDTLGQLLSALPELRYLKWQRFESISGPQYTEQASINVDSLATSLQSAQKVEELVIQAMRDEDPDEIVLRRSRFNIHGTLNGLESLLRLRKLQIPWVFVMGAGPGPKRSLSEVLTPGLERLTLTSDFWDEVGWNWTALSILSTVKDEINTQHPHIRSPNLKHVLLDVANIYYLGTSGFTEVWCEDLERLTEMTSIMFTCQYHHRQLIEGQRVWHQDTANDGESKDYSRQMGPMDHLAASSFEQTPYRYRFRLSE